MMVKIFTSIGPNTMPWSQEISQPGVGREAFDWKPITSLLAGTLTDAAEKPQWYALRWKIKVFFKILKSGCRVEESKLRTADSLCKFLLVYFLLARTVFWITMIGRSAKSRSPLVALSEREIKILDLLKHSDGSKESKNLST